MARNAEKVQLALVVEFLKKKGRDSIKIDDIIGLAETMAKTLDGTMLRVDSELHGEFSAIASEISSLKRDIYDLRPDHMRFERIPEAGRELDAVLEATEEATHAIMEAAEIIMAASDSDPVAYRELVGDKVMEIFEACTFQDLTGQRVRKVVKTLTWIETRIAKIAEKLSIVPIPVATDDPVEESDDERRMRELILNGPQMKGDGVSQDDVDNFFSKSDQGDIDRMFG